MVNFVGENGSRWTFDPSAPLGERGGFGEVFEGAGQDGQHVAVKRVPLQLDSDSARRLREREVEIAEALDSIESNHLMPTLDIGRVENDLLIVMPRALRSLAEAIRSDDMSHAQRVDAIRQIATGLVELASASIVHRDLKPQNVRELEGTWVLSDFGIARDLRETTGTVTFLGFGTPEYMAPELWLGQRASIKSDLYALGVVAFELLSGVRPFLGPARDDLFLQHQQTAPPIPAGPPSLAREILRLLSKNPSDRPQDARAVVEAFNAATIPLSPAQEALRATALEAASRSAANEARNATEAAERSQEEAHRHQAASDLKNIFERAEDLTASAIPEASYRFDGAQHILRAANAYVLALSWPYSNLAGLRSDDPLVAAGVIHFNPPPGWNNVVNGRFDGAGQPMANIVCERLGTRLEWLSLRFTASALVGNNYAYGPIDRKHGFDQSTFVDQRSYMLHPGGHVWHMDRQLLSPERIVELLGEAMKNL